MSPIKRTTKMPKYVRAVFGRNPIRESVYDITDPHGEFPFTWFRVSDPQNEFLIKQGAKKVAESFTGKVKVLFTGMRRMGTTLWYEGDCFIAGKKSLVLFRYRDESKEFDIYLYFPHIIRVQR